MRVVAGQYRRRVLLAPPGLATRPTSDRLRETMFNVLAPRLKGASFLDLYAGSGANGIEAMSRGAARVTFVERAAPALAAIRSNLAALRIASGYLIEARAAAAFLHKAGKSIEDKYDIIFLDPPYDAGNEYAVSLELLGGEGKGLLRAGAIVVAEHRRARGSATVTVPVQGYGMLRRSRVLEQGDAALSFYVAASE